MTSRLSNIRVPDLLTFQFLTSWPSKLYDFLTSWRSNLTSWLLDLAIFEFLASWLSNLCVLDFLTFLSVWLLFLTSWHLDFMISWLHDFLTSWVLDLLFNLLKLAFLDFSTTFNCFWLFHLFDFLSNSNLITSIYLELKNRYIYSNRHELWSFPAPHLLSVLMYPFCLSEYAFSD